MVISTDVIEFIFSAALFLNALLFIPQAARIFTEKTAVGVSLLTFIGFLIIQLAIILHAIVMHDYLLMGGYLFSLLTCGSVVVLILFYRKRKNSLIDDLTLEEIVAQLPGHIYWKDKHCIFAGCNTNNWKDFGVNSLSEFIGKTDYDLFSKEEADQLRMIDEEVMRENKMRVAEEQLTKSDRSKAIYLSHKQPLINKKGKIVGMLGCSIDIIDAKQKILDQLAMLENIIAVMPGNVYWMDKKGIYLGCNDNEAKSVGLNSRKDIVGKRNIDIPGFVIPEILDPINEEVIGQGKTITIEEPAILQDGRKAVFLSNKVPVHDSKGNIAGLVGISFDITDRKKAEQELKIAKETAEAANHAKSEFLNNMKHDLRTPFSGILGIAQLMEAKETDPEKKENLSYISQSARVLLNHLNEIFEFINAESGQLPLLDKQFDLHELLQDMEKITLPTAKDKNIEFSTTRDTELPQYVIGDRVRTQRILMNLVSNAVKFTSAGYVRLRAEAVKRGSKEIVVNFIVEDTGMGIPEDKRDLIFEQFHRLTPSYEGVYPGKGLGLRIVKRFLDELGGEAHLTSELGKGSVFKILIPYKQTLLNRAEELL